MNTPFPMIWSTLGKKILMALTGLFLIMFLVGHLAGNLQLLTGDPVPFNRYAHFLLSLGALLIAVEVVLVAAFLIHLISGILVVLNNRSSREDKYVMYQSAGATSRKTLSSSTMIWTGLVLLGFVVFHVYTFKYGPGIEQGYVMEIDGERVRDLYRLTIEVFQKPGYVIWYVAAMIFLGFHLRHGFWSAFQSLGAYHPRYTPVIYGAGIVIAVLLGVGFLGIPVWIFFQGGS